MSFLRRFLGFLCPYFANPAYIPPVVYAPSNKVIARGSRRLPLDASFTAKLIHWHRKFGGF